MPKKLKRGKRKVRNGDPLGIRKGVRVNKVVKKPKRFVKIKWYAYLIFTAVLLGFVEPGMISAKDTMLVIGGLILLVVWAEISYYFWIKPLIRHLKEDEL